MMHRTEIVDLLSLIATYDQRTVGASDVEAWFTIAELGQWTMPLARRAVIEYHLRGGGNFRIKPAHITDALDRVRDAVRRTTLAADLVPPRELADDPRAEIAWRRQAIEMLKQQALDAWADTGRIPQDEPLTLPEAVGEPPREMRRLIGPAFAMPADISRRRSR